MTEILRSPSQFPSSPRRALSCGPNNDPEEPLSSSLHGSVGDDDEAEEGNDSVGGCGGGGGGGALERKSERGAGGGGVEADAQLSVLALLLTVLRKSLLGCKTDGACEEELRRMEIGWPTDVRHVAHVTFDRFHGFLGLPVEFEPEVPRRAPSASTTVFGVSTQSMQCSYDSRGNSVPTILLLMQRHLYEQGGLRAEGIFRIAAENSQEEYVREQLNNGIVPEGIDVHCLACLIKAWFRELPTGVLDSLSSEQVMHFQTEEDCVQLTRLLPPVEAALLDWSVNLMADVVQEEHLNKMNARNIATVFAPNMTQMADPLTALMYAVQVMNFLRMLILKTLKERQDNTVIDSSALHIDPSDKNDHQSSQLEVSSEVETEQGCVYEEPVLDKVFQVPDVICATVAAVRSSESSRNYAELDVTALYTTNMCLLEKPADTKCPPIAKYVLANASNPIHARSHRSKMNRSNSSHRKARRHKTQSTVPASTPADKSKGPSNVSRINSKVERAEAWR